MTPILDSLQGSLNSLQPGSAPERMIVALQELDQIVSEHRKSLDPQLVHFLERRSYDKARVWLQENSTSQSS